MLYDGDANAVLVLHRTQDRLLLKRTEGPSFHGPAKLQRWLINKRLSNNSLWVRLTTNPGLCHASTSETYSHTQDYKKELPFHFILPITIVLNHIL